VTVSRFRRYIGIWPGEERLVLRLLVILFVGMAGAALGASGIESLLFSRSGTDSLPYLYVAVGPLTLAVMLGMSVVTAGPATSLLVRVPLFLAAFLLVARAAVGFGAEATYPAVWLVMMVVWTAQVMATWALAGAVCDTRQAKRLFPLFGASLIAGTGLGGLITGPLAALVHAENLIIVWAGALFLAWLPSRALRLGQAGGPSPRRRTGGAERLAGGFNDLWSSSLLRRMSASMSLFAVMYFVFSFLFAQAITAHFPRTDDLAGFLGLFMGSSNVAALVISLILANRLFASFGLASMVLIMPVIYLVGFVALAAGAGFWALVGIRFGQMVWMSGIWATGWQALFNVVPTERRARVRAIMDGGPRQVGVVAAGCLLIVADRFAGDRFLQVVGAVIAAAAVLTMWRARRAYAGALVEALHAGNPDVFPRSDGGLGRLFGDAEAHATLIAGASDPDAATRRMSIEILAGLGRPDLIPALVSGLGDADPAVRAAAVAGVIRQRETEHLLPLLLDPDPSVKALAAAASLPNADARVVLDEMRTDRRADRRASAVRALGHVGMNADDVIAALSDHDPVVRTAAAEALVAFGLDVSVGPLERALRDEDPGVRRPAADSLATLGGAGEAALVRALADPKLEEDVLRALSAIPMPPSEELRAYAHDQTIRATRDHELWLRLGADRDDWSSLLSHAVRSRAIEHGVHALRVMTRLGDRPTMETAIENLFSSDAQQRANAVEALEGTGDRRLVRALIPLWDGPVRGLGDPAGVMPELLMDPDPLVKDIASATMEGGTMETLATVPLLERMVFLRKVPMFTELPPADLQHIAEAAKEHSYSDGDVIATQGESGDEMHIVVAGEIDVTMREDVGPDRTVAHRERGEHVGELAVLSGATRMASLVCSGSVRTLSLDRRTLERILRERPDVSLAVLRVLSDRLRQAYGVEA
jgi:HEAT repeat protein